MFYQETLDRLYLHTVLITLFITVYDHYVVIFRKLQHQLETYKEKSKSKSRSKEQVYF